jgi:hypothetical protein
MLEPAFSSSPDSASACGRRAAARLRLSIPARMLTIHGIHDCILLDLSRTGARIALTMPLQVGADGFLKVGPVEAFGQTVRRDGGCGGGINGIKFDEPLAQTDVLAVRHHAETFRVRERDSLRDQVRRWVTGEM